MNTIKSNRGFTLIELLVVIAIIAILTGVILVALQSSRGKARDGQRISDISQIQLALEQYFDRCGQYPPASFMTTSALSSITNGCPSIPTQISMATFISKIPTFPNGGLSSQTVYYYAVNPTNTDYILGTGLENYNAVVLDGLNYQSGTPSGWSTDLPPMTGYSNGAPFICSNVSGTQDYCVGPK